MGSQERLQRFSPRGRGTHDKEHRVLIRTFRGDVEVGYDRKEESTLMVTTWLRVLSGAAVAGLLLTSVWAQTASKTGPKYDMKNEVKIKGVIEEIRQVPGPFEGTHLVVKTDSKNVLVHVAPADFLKDIDTSFNKGELIEVVGCKAPDATEEEILAREITVGQNTTTLRDDKGVPVWVGWKPGGK